MPLAHEPDRPADSDRSIVRLLLGPQQPSEPQLTTLEVHVGTDTGADVERAVLVPEGLYGAEEVAADAVDGLLGR
jgi:hypothetical protein